MGLTRFSEGALRKQRPLGGLFAAAPVRVLALQAGRFCGKMYENGAVSAGFRQRKPERLQEASAARKGSGGERDWR